MTPRGASLNAMPEARQSALNESAEVARLRAYFESGATCDIAVRRAELKKLSEALRENEPAILAALQSDLGKSPYQSYSTELALVHEELRLALRDLRKWTKPSRRRTPWLSWPARGWVQQAPFGVALIIGPWNYPVQLLLMPLVSAIAAGNCIVLKPSELAPRTSGVIAKIMRETFALDFISVAEGNRDVAAALLRERFDKIFFTGSARVGRMVMAAAARNLTPVVLELGGKCPAIVCADADIEIAARRIAWGKFMNAGQTCVAPDHVWVQSDVRSQFVGAIENALRGFYGADPAKSEDYGRIINAQHFTRLTSYLQEGTIIFGGKHDADDLFLEPTILTDVADDSAVMEEEIFGPILPVMEFDEVERVISWLRKQPSPLALYLFARDRATEGRVLAETKSGSVCVNDVVLQMTGGDLPFGGVGESGMGRYHGRAGFEAFSFPRTIMRRANRPDLFFRYPPPRLSIARLRRVLDWLLRS